MTQTNSKWHKHASKQHNANFYKLTAYNTRKSEINSKWHKVKKGISLLNDLFHVNVKFIGVRETLFSFDYVLKLRKLVGAIYRKKNLYKKTY